MPTEPLTLSPKQTRAVKDLAREVLSLYREGEIIPRRYTYFENCPTRPCYACAIGSAIYQRALTRRRVLGGPECYNLLASIEDIPQQFWIELELAFSGCCAIVVEDEDLPPFKKLYEKESPEDAFEKIWEMIEERGTIDFSGGDPQ